MKTSKNRALIFAGILGLASSCAKQDPGESQSQSKAAADDSTAISANELEDAYNNGTFELAAQQRGLGRQFVEDMRQCLRSHNKFRECLKMELAKRHQNQTDGAQDVIADPTPASSTTPSAMPSVASDPGPNSDCATDSAIIDPQATYQFPKTTKIMMPAAGSYWMPIDPIGKFVFDAITKNPALGDGKHPQFAVIANDEDSNLTACRLKGYASVGTSEVLDVSPFAAKSGLKFTCFVYQWSSASKHFEYVLKDKTSDCPTGLGYLTCKGKLKDSCVADQTWIHH